MVSTKYDLKYFKDKERDVIFDGQFPIIRASEGPWGNFEEICNHPDPDYKWTDVTFPFNRFICWFNHRPPKPSHDLSPVVQNLFMDFQRAGDIDPEYVLWSKKYPADCNDVG